MGGFSKRRIATVFQILLLIYVAALIVSHLVRLNRSSQFPYLPGQVFVQANEMKGSDQVSSKVNMAYLDLEANDSDAPVLVLLHGSPVASSSLKRTVNALKGQFRLIVPDLPGFGGSTRKVKDYSILAHAYYLTN